MHHLQMARTQAQADVVIAVMSGSFLQRGEPAILSRWARTEMALSSGADIVVELPYAYSVQTAERFAEGAVQILSALGCTSLNFGSEAGEITPFNSLVTFMSKHKQRYDEHVQHFLKQGSSYPNASASAFALLEGSEQLLPLSKPNNILGFHYVQAIRKLHSAMKPETTLRIQSDYHETTIKKGPIASATSIRNALNDGKPIDDVVPQKTAKRINHYQDEHGLLHFWERYFPYLHYQITTRSPEEIRQFAECEEGIEYRLIETGLKASTFEEWLSLLKTKRYTRTRLQRLFVHLLTSTRKEELKSIHTSSLQYIRLLGMNDQGRNYLKHYKKHLPVPLLTKHAELKRFGPAGQLDLRTAHCYWLCLPSENISKQLTAEYKQTPIYTKKHGI